MDFTIRELRPKDPADAAGLAAMWNASDSEWPGGWTHGIPETAERILERKEKSERLAVFVAETGDGQIIGYGDLQAQAGQKDVAYLPLLNARPDFHGKGVGKALILKALERTIELGYKQLTLATWPGNEKAMPLYKKTGFFWVPETSVFMQNFIPTAVTVSLAQPFFHKHDWYQAFRRDLSVKPDEIEWKGIKVYPYHFEMDGDLFRMVVDKQAEQVTEVETNDVRVACWVGKEEVVVGLPHTVRWEVESKTAKPLNVTLIAQGDEGIALEVLETLKVRGKAALEKTFTVAPDIELPDPGKPQPLIRSTLLLGGQAVHLGTAVKPVQPVDLQFQGQTLIPGKSEEKVVMRLKSNLDLDMTGTLFIDPHPKLAFDALSKPFTLPAKSWTAVTFWAEAEAVGAFATKVKAECRIPNNEVSDERPSRPHTGPSGDQSSPLTTGTPGVRHRPLLTKPRAVVFAAVPVEGGVVGYINEEAKQACLGSAGLCVYVNLRGGDMSLHDRISQRGMCHQRMPELGPPFVGWRRVPPLHEGRIQGNSIVVTAPSDTLPGMVVERTVTLTGGPVVRVDVRVLNTTGSAWKLKLRIDQWANRSGRVTLPTKHGLVHELIGGWGEYPSGRSNDVSNKPCDYTETWSAAEENGNVVGMIWGTCEEHDFRSPLPSLQFDLPELPPQSHHDLEPIYLIGGQGDWEKVRQYWRWLKQPSRVREERSPAATPVLTARLDPHPLAIASQVTEATVSVMQRRGKTLKGHLRVARCTRAGTTGLRIKPTEFDLAEVSQDKPFSAPVTIRVRDLCPRVIDTSLVLDQDVTTHEFSTPLIVLGNTSAPVTVSTEHPPPNTKPTAAPRWPHTPTLRLHNGPLSLTVAPDFLGSAVALETGGGTGSIAAGVSEAVNHLRSSYPEARPFLWMNPWHGGLHPFVGWMGDERFLRAKFSGEPVEHTGTRGLFWRGVKVKAEMTHKDLKWLRMECEYVTLGGSNVLGLVLRVINLTDCLQWTKAGIAVWTQPGAAFGNTVLHYQRTVPRYEHGTTRDHLRVAYQRRRGEYATEHESGRWTAVENPETGDMLALIAASHRAGVRAEDTGKEGAHLTMETNFDLEAHETKETVAYLVHCRSMESAEQYRALAELEELP